MAVFWDNQKAIYRDSKGKEIPYDTIRDYIDSVSDHSILQLQATTKKRNEGEGTHAAWVSGALGIIRPSLIASSLIGIGGRQQLTPALSNEIGKEVKFHLDHFKTFSTQFENEEVSGLEAAARVSMYGAAVVTAFEVMTSRVKSLAGYKEAKNILAKEAIHCDQCPKLSDLGWISISDMPAVGKRTCLTRDRCRVIYR